VTNIETVDATISEWTQTRCKQDLFERLMAQRVPCAPVRNLSEVVNDPHLHARGMLQWQDHPELGRIVVQHSPLRFAGDPQRPLEPSRTLGADTGRVLEDRLGLTPEQIAALAARGAI
jgi:CoA:oxalate CoA-transferase